ncbi:hypothetical protein ACWG0P_00750 [Amedibacillus sp. YH-ame6]
MKHSILRVNSLPNLYKHCSKIQLLHIELQNYGVDDDPAFVQAYLDYVREQMYSSIETNNVTAQATKVISRIESFVIFKSNVNTRMMLDTLHALFAELSEYCDNKVEISYQFTGAIIYLDGKAASLFHKVDGKDEIQDDESYLTNKIGYDGKAKPRGKYLLSMSQYHDIYDRMPKRTSPSTVVTKEKESIVSNDVDVEYCI